MSNTAEVKSRPIIMDAESVRAILGGRKTQTRRVVKPSREAREHFRALRAGFYPGRRWWVGAHPGGGWWAVDFSDGPSPKHRPRGRGFDCPYGSPGGLLWVRETWQALHYEEPFMGEGDYDYWPAESIPEDDGEGFWSVVYAATGPLANEHPEDRGFAWRSPIYMPKWAARLWLRVTDVRVERVQEISTEDVWAEGVRISVSEEDRRPLMRLTSNAAGKVPASYLPKGRCFPDQPPLTEDEWAMSHFADRWDDLNAKRGYPWEENPWVWVVDFETTEAPE